ncbi:MAG TPA: hypothetical protein VHE81_17520 [Lacipirellulaceae bacterium]|nr:hypothetical protein [Lacipirellulaceae bacterium]
MQNANCKMQIGGRAVDRRRASALRYLSALMLIYGASGIAARADVFELSSGGWLEGELVKTNEADKSNYTISLATGGRVTIPRSEVSKIDNVSVDEAEYQKLARSSPDTVEGHWKMAEWCRQHNLRSDRQQHLERILELDPNHVASRTALGFHKQDGQWMNRDDVMASRGLELYQGRYLAPQQIELLKQQKESRVTQADWTNRIEQLRRWLVGHRQDRAAQAHAEILSIHDPQAADAVVAALHRETVPDLKRMWIDVASRLDARSAIDALVNLSLSDPDAEIRNDCLEYLIKTRRVGLAVPYIRALKDKDNTIVNRAGAALGQIGDRDAMGALIDALITKHRVKVSDANSDQHAYTFSKDGGVFSFGGSGPQYVVQSLRNRAVLDALVKLSDGSNFEYDQIQWRRWLAAQSKATPVDIRRDP